MEKIKKYVNENKGLVIFWGVILAAAAAILIISNIIKAPRKQIASKNPNTDSYVQTEAGTNKNKKPAGKIVFSQSTVILNVGGSETVVVKEGRSTKYDLEIK